MRKIVFRLTIASLLIFSAVLAQADTFKIGLVFDSWQNNQDPKQLAQHFADELNRATKASGDKFEVVKFKAPKDAVEAIKDHKIDLAYTKIQGYALLDNPMKDIKLLAVPYTFNPETHQKQLNYDSYFVTLKSNKDINNWQDLKGKKFFFAHADSLSGFVYPVTMLKDNGVDYRQFFSVTSFAQAHQHTLEMLQNKKYDAAAIWDSVFFNSSLHNNFKIICRIKGIPNPPIMASTTLTADQISKLQTVLTGVKEDALKDFYIAGFCTNIPDSFYNDAIKRVKEAQNLLTV